MYSPIKAADHSKNVVRLNSIERELFCRRTRSMRRQLETCQESYSSMKNQQNLKKSKIFSNKVKESSHGTSHSHQTNSNVVDGVIGRHENDERNAKVSGKTAASESADIDDGHGLALKYGSSGNEKFGSGDYYDWKRNIEGDGVKCKNGEQINDAKHKLSRLRRPPLFRSPTTSTVPTHHRPKSKKFSSVSPSSGLAQFLVPTKPTSPKKHRRCKPAQSFQIRMEPGPNLEPAKCLEISNYRSMQLPEKNDVKFMDSTQIRIKEFLDKTCADAARSRTQIGPAVSLSDLAAIDDQQTSMPILVEGILAPEERKRQVSKVYPMRTPSPLHTSHLFGAGHSTRSNSRVLKNEHPGRPVSPLNLPPIILPPIRENKEFQPSPRRCSWSSSACGEEDQSTSKAMTEEDWRSLRKCRYLRIPQTAEQASFIDNIESVFK